jgi:hypothetical protein
MWRETTKHERNRRIFFEELDDFLPEVLIDFHVHILNDGVLPPGETFSCAGHPVRVYDLDDLRTDLAEAYPERDALALCFGFPDPCYDRHRNNTYLAESCDNVRFFSLYLFDPHDETPETLADRVRGGRFLGLKPYPDYVRREDVSSVEIPEMLPEWALEVADELGLLILLHIPRRDRLADPLNQRHIREVCERYPNVNLVLAHIGRAYYLRNIAGNLEGLRDLPNLYYDLAMLNNPDVLEYGFRELPPEKLLFGTDAPLAFAPGKAVEINHQYTYVTPVPWKLSISDDHGRLRFTSFVYEELRAIREAVRRLGLDRAFVDRLFFRNAAGLLGLPAGDPGSNAAPARDSERR